ncbi:aminodeoxychorismate lyase [Paenibacillus larvae subsp. larvae DSM 25430]|uniref:Endolytic murein transglycosylase n=1 Tax=Paenibacillus larvae subsp. larvae DSM 25430 TaxID=697284 RepID=V9WBP6_9BACL|nr:aminodeoxychorismate lyase [Paenibacillus larvae subsp. larvae DSM 25430]
MWNKGGTLVSVNQTYRPRSKAKKIWLSFLALVMIVVAGSVFYVINALKPLEPSDETKRIEIQLGDGIKTLGNKLEQAGLIKDGTLFYYYSKLKGLGGNIKAGEYELKPGLTYEAILDKFTKGDVMKNSRFTVPEGYTIDQIAEKLKETGVISEEEFLGKVEKAGVEPLTSAIPADIPLKHRLEGYLFPTTYELKKDITADSLIDSMLSTMDKKLKEIPGFNQETLAKLGVNQHQLLTVASLIEREVVVDAERPLVAGVIYNRLSKGMPLQIDATIQYALGKQKERLMESDLNIDSPYNTYTHKGLPPGPIASPSEASIKAALNPEASQYFYYVTKKDGSGAHLFAETYEQHKKNIEESKKNVK